jgi:universal stress protein E
MAGARKVFVVLDPTSMEQVSLEWGEKIALDMKEHRSEEVNLHVYCCINHKSVAPVPHGDPEELERATVKRVDEWVQRLVMHTRALGIPVETEIEWESDWRAAIVAAARRQKSDVVIKNLRQHARLVRLVRDTADWQLIRDCECPVLLVKTGRLYGINKILVAVKHTEDEAYREANAGIVERAQRLAADLGATLHAVTCYDSDDRPDRQRFADSFGLDRSQVSAAMGNQAKVIASVAEEVAADMLVIARVARPESAGLLGDTARKVIDEIDTDVLVLPMAS